MEVDVAALENGDVRGAGERTSAEKAGDGGRCDAYRGEGREGGAFLRRHGEFRCLLCCRVVCKGCDPAVGGAWCRLKRFRRCRGKENVTKGRSKKEDKALMEGWKFGVIRVRAGEMISVQECGG